MWESDCGVLPVVDEFRKVIGVVTDRDICIALTTSDRRASSLKVSDAGVMRAVVCGPDAEIESALETMKAHRVHRLPVVSKAGLLEGIVSMNDILLRAKRAVGRKKPEVSCEEVVEALQTICAHGPAARHSAAAAR